MLKLRSIGLSNHSVLEGEQRIGRIRFADEQRALADAGLIEQSNPEGPVSKR